MSHARRIFLPILTLAAGLAALPVAGQETADHTRRPVGTTFSVAVNLIKVPVSVFNEKGAPLPELHAGDFRIYEDGIPQEVRNCGIDRTPVSLVLVIDTSATVEKELKKIKQAAREFVSALSPEDRIAVIAFSDEAVRVLDWTPNGKAVHKTLRDLESGMRTALYDAMHMAANETLRGVEGRKAIILLTDALNNQSRVSFEQAARAIVQSQASCYVVSKTAMIRKDAMKQRRVVWLNSVYRRMFGDANYIEEFFKKREAEMIELAERTGGRCLFPADYDQIGSAYGEIAKELKSKYYLTYVSNQQLAADSYHRITVEYLPPAGRLVYRQGYFHQPLYR